MVVKFKNETSSLKDFLLSDKEKGLVLIDYGRDGYIPCQVFKIKDINDTDVVFFNEICENQEIDEFGNVIMDTYKFTRMLHINKEHKYILYNKMYPNIKSDVESVNGYNSFMPSDLADTMEDEYAETFYNLMASTLPEIKKSKEYKELNKIKLKEEANTHYIQRLIKSVLLREQDIPERKYRIKRLEEGFNNFDKYLLHDYLSNANFIEELVAKNFSDDYILEDIIFVDIFNEILKEELSNFSKAANAEEFKALSTKKSLIKKLINAATSKDKDKHKFTNKEEYYKYLEENHYLWCDSVTKCVHCDSEDIDMVDILYEMGAYLIEKTMVCKDCGEILGKFSYDTLVVGEALTNPDMEL